MPGQVVKEIEARFRANTTAYRQEIANAGKITANLRNQIQQASETLGRVGSAAGKQGAAISRSLKGAEKAAERISKSAQTLVGKERELSRAVDEQTRKLADQRGEYQRLSGDVERLNGVYDTIREATRGLDLSTPLAKQREQVSAEMDRLEQDIRTMEAGIASAGKGGLVPVGDSFIGLDEAKTRLQAMIATSDQAAERFRRLDEAIQAIGEENLGYASKAGLKQLQTDIAGSQRRMVQLEQQAGQTELRLTTYTERLEDVRRGEEQLGEATERLSEQVAELGNTASALEFSQLTQQAEQTAPPVEELTEDVDQLGETAARSTAPKLEELSGGFSTLGKRALDSGKSIISGVGTMVKAMVGIRSVYMLIRKFRAAMVEGFKELSNYSKEVKTSLGTMSAASNQWKNSIAAAFAPLVTTAAPYITAFIRYIADAFNAAGAFFAALTGKSSYTRAVYNYQGISDAAGSAAAATHNAAQAQEELNRQLMGFDQINKLSDSSGGSGGSGGGGNGGSSGSSGVGNGLSFVTEGIPGGLSDAAQKVRDFFSSLDFGPLEAAWDRLTAAGGRLAEIIKGGLAWGLEHVLKPLAQWSIEEAAPRLVDLLANSLDVLADTLTVLKPVWDWVWEHLFVPIINLAANTLTGSLDALNTVLEDTHGGLQGIIDVMNGKKTLGELLKEWFTIPNVASLLLDLGALADKAGTLVTLATNPVALSVKLTQIGWTTVADWIGEQMGPKVVKAVGLAKDGWSNVKDWVKDSIGGGLNKAIGLAKDSWSNVKDWVKGSMGGGLNKAIGLAKDGWSNVSGWVKGNLGKGVSVAVNLLKGWKSTVAKALGLDKLSAKFQIKLPKVEITWSKGKIPLPSFHLKWNARGGILDGATIFGMMGSTLLGGGEAGREAVLPLDNNTGWMDQLADRLAQRMGGSGSNQPIVVQVTLDGRVVAESTVRELHGMTREGRDPLAGLV